MLNAVETRLEARVTDLAGRVRPAADFARLMASGAQPSGGVNAYVLPSSMRGGRASAMTGTFSQEVIKGVSVVLFLASVDGQGAAALARIDSLLTEIIDALCGWAPADEVGVFTLGQSRFAPSSSGLMSWVIEFQIMDHLRIDT